MVHRNFLAASVLARALAPVACGGKKPPVKDPNAEDANKPKEPPPPPPAPTVATSWSGGSPRTTEEDRIFKINGRVMYDAFNLSTDDLAATNQNYSRTFVRRAFLGVEGQFTQNWKYNIKLQFAPGADAATSTTTTLRLCQNTTTFAIAQRSACQAGEADRGPVVTAVSTSGADTEVGFDDAFIQYVMGDWEITLGQNNQVSPMEDRTSSLNIPFNERSSYINAFGFAKIGSIAVTTSGGNWSARASLTSARLPSRRASAAASAAVSGRPVKKVLEMTPVRLPKTKKSYHSKVVPAEEAAMTVRSVFGSTSSLAAVAAISAMRGVPSPMMRLRLV